MTRPAMLSGRLRLPSCLLALLLLAACGVEPSREFVFENAGHTSFTVRVNDRLRFQVLPGETKSFYTPNNKGERHVLIVDEQNVTKLDRRFTWDELEAMGFRIRVE